MAIKEFTEDEIVQWVRRRLGGSKIDVELSDADITDGIQSAIEIFSKYKPRLMLDVIDVVAGIDRYKLCNYGRGIFEVSAGSRNVYDLSMGFGFPIPYEYRIPGLEMEKYEGYLMWQEEANRIYSVAFDWRFSEPYLYVINIPTTATQLFYSYWDDHKLDSIPGPWRDWVKRWSVAEAREILAEMRGKYDTIPSAGGGVRLNADTLRTDAQAEKERLMIVLEGGRGDLPPTWG